MEERRREEARGLGTLGHVVDGWTEEQEALSMRLMWPKKPSSRRRGHSD